MCCKHGAGIEVQLRPIKPGQSWSQVTEILIPDFVAAGAAQTVDHVRN